MSAQQLISQPLDHTEMDMKTFIDQHKKSECTGHILQLYKISVVTKEISDPKNPNAKPTKVTNKYMTICFRFFNDETKSYYFHSANRIKFANQLCSISKAQSVTSGKPKFCVLRFKEWKREEIASGDYVMPDTKELSEDKAAEMKTRYESNIDDLVAANRLLIDFHTALEYEWQCFNIRLKAGVKDASTGVVSGNYIPEKCEVRSTILSKIESTKNDGTSETKTIDPRYTWKIPVFTPHVKTSQRALQFAGRLGQVYSNSDEFHPAVFDMDASKKVNAAGKKEMIEARLVGTKNGQPHCESLTYLNVSKFITRKSRISGYIDCTNATVSSQGSNFRILAPHNVVKRHKTVEKTQEMSEQEFERQTEMDESFATVEDTGFNFDQLETDFKGMSVSGQAPRETPQIHGDVSELGNLQVNIGSGLQTPNQQYGLNPYGQPQPQQYGQPQQYAQPPVQYAQPLAQYAQPQPQQYGQPQPQPPAQQPNMGFGTATNNYVSMLLQNKPQA